MGKETGISWTHHTANFWRGCIKVAPECSMCYADQLAKRNPSTLGTWGSEKAGGVRVVAAEAYWKEPLKWNREAEAAGERRRVFCMSLADVFEEWDGPMFNHKGQQLWQSGSTKIPWEAAEASYRRAITMADVRARVFEVIDQCRWLDFLLLTKRPQNIREMWPEFNGVPSGENWRISGKPGALQMVTRRTNCWLGTSAGTQESADKFVPHLLKCRDLSPVLFASCEPMLDPPDFTPYCGGRSYQCQCGYHSTESELIFLGGDSWRCAQCGKVCQIGATLDWMIIGCESSGRSLGRLGAFKNWSSWNDHAAKIVQLCRDTQTTPFVKQIPINGKLSHEVSEWPEALQVQEFPTSESLVRA